MAMLGMDPDKVEAMGKEMQRLADQINSQIIPRIDHLVSQIPAEWNGKDATDFQGWWTQQHKGQMKTAANDLHGLGQSALNNASDQRNTSGPGHA